MLFIAIGLDTINLKKIKWKMDSKTNQGACSIRANTISDKAVIVIPPGKRISPCNGYG